ncbi:hypothetical protein FSP39_004246 [Pinctada imbricata]|uniref:MD-2-related lipid-recognition domain-containing protein n=1 Tax=Pinctada imbricata TaxID=66713 RepID=A0AA89BYM9_PINIB|nr:hypothetical protein FSP39_004246 [Pinctada imbricata]
MELSTISLCPIPCPKAKVTPDLPIKQNSNVVYTNGIPVLKSYPKLSLVVKWELQDDQGKDLFCFAIPAQVVD